MRSCVKYRQIFDILQRTASERLVPNQEEYCTESFEVALDRDSFCREASVSKAADENKIIVWKTSRRRWLELSSFIKLYIKLLKK